MDRDHDFLRFGSAQDLNLEQCPQPAQANIRRPRVHFESPSPHRQRREHLNEEQLRDRLDRPHRGVELTDEELHDRLHFSDSVKPRKKYVDDGELYNRLGSQASLAFPPAECWDCHDRRLQKVFDSWNEETQSFIIQHPPPPSMNPHCSCSNCEGWYQPTTCLCRSRQLHARDARDYARPGSPHLYRSKSDYHLHASRYRPALGELCHIKESRAMANDKPGLHALDQDRTSNTGRWSPPPLRRSRSGEIRTASSSSGGGRKESKSHKSKAKRGLEKFLRAPALPIAYFATLLTARRGQ